MTTRRKSGGGRPQKQLSLVSDRVKNQKEGGTKIQRSRRRRGRQNDGKGQGILLIAEGRGSGTGRDDKEGLMV